MRFMSAEKIREGMTLGRPLFGSNFEVMLNQGHILTQNNIEHIKSLGYFGVYIQDNLSADADVRDIVPSELRMETIRAAKDLLLRAERDSGQKNVRKVSIAAQQKIVMPIISSLISNRRRVVDIIDLKPFDDYSYYHAANVVMLSLLLGVELGISGNQLYELGMAALLHDVGNIFIPKAILQKEGKLTREEYDVVKQHSEMGFQFLRDNYEISIDACIGAQQHHENYDGTGYPSRLKKNKISIYGRIIAVTDVYDALTSRRPYRNALYPAQAMEYMQQQAGAMFDPEIVAELARVVALYPVGTCVELSSGVRCLVVQNYPGCALRPRLRLLGSMSSTPMYIDLQNDPSFSHITVVRIVDMEE